MKDSAVTIGQLAKRSGVGVETVRFYERRGLLPAPARDPSSGYRQYRPADVKRVRFIRRAKDLGFSLKDIAALLSLRADSESGCDAARALAKDKLAEIESKIADLTRIQHALERAATRCASGGPLQECPILASLEETE